ncbi:unnamed protein product, partial [Nesidiocoris tenuis]
MNVIFQWLCGHSLSLNVQKTKYMVISNSPSRRFLDETTLAYTYATIAWITPEDAPRSKEYRTFAIWA